jgi:PHD/YefM family antitoxin component YafN of YafNO toxin-antitoxin module
MIPYDYKKEGAFMEIEAIRPSADLRNHYNEISKACHESRQPIVITLNGREDTAVIGFQELKQLYSELELLRTLAESEDDVIHEKVAPIKETFDGIRQSLLLRKNG